MWRCQQHPRVLPAVPGCRGRIPPGGSLAPPGTEPGLRWRHASVPGVLSHLAGVLFLHRLRSQAVDALRGAVGEGRQQPGSSCRSRRPAAPAPLPTREASASVQRIPNRARWGSARLSLRPPGGWLLGLLPFLAPLSAVGPAPTGWVAAASLQTRAETVSSSFCFCFQSVRRSSRRAVPWLEGSAASPACPRGHDAGSAAPCTARGWCCHRCCSKLARLLCRVPLFGWGAQFFGNSDLCRHRCRGPVPPVWPQRHPPHPPSLPLPTLGTSGEIAGVPGPVLRSQHRLQPRRPCPRTARPCRCFGKHVCQEAAASFAQNRRKVTERSPEDSPKPANPAG